ncbi:hypothetical protein [Actinoplanes sp. NPDC051411]|uniref:hypothetical protein n=1 Tax=Actinoplanes sp. NPDC051411 TaxID=3155522 RepID=UPI0034159EA3
MNDHKSDFPVIVSVHPESGLDDLPNSGITWGVLLDPGLALLVPPPPERAAGLSGPLRMLAGPREPAVDTLLDAPVARTLHPRSPDGRAYLAMQADLADWTLAGRAPWSTGPGDLFDDDAAASCDVILSRCTAPNVSWFDLAGKARAGRGRPPHKYPFEEWPVLDPSEDPEMTFGRSHKRGKPIWAVIAGHFARRG